ncbi:MAG: hypothetical protein II938_01185 [Alphaproteobacteria bacterium]|nr:hypothetical protein [Alphaproteobacteria bacterium]
MEQVISQDIQFITKCFKLLRKLNLVSSQYQFSEQYLNKNKYYMGMILSEGRQPSIDALHNLIHNLCELHSQTATTYIAQLHEQGQQLLTQRLLKFL